MFNTVEVMIVSILNFQVIRGQIAFRAIVLVLHHHIRVRI